MSHPHASKKIVFFDGVCSLCNRSVDFIFKKDKQQVLLFAPLQGTTAAALLPAKDATSLSSIIYYANGKIWHKSDAVLHLLWDMGGVWKGMSVLKIFPRFIRNAVYDWIAKNRYRWFGEKETCRLPTPEERSRFLD